MNAAEYQQLVHQVEEAQKLLGADRVKLAEDLGSVKMVVDVFEMLDAEIALNLGFLPEEPVFLTFCYDNSIIPTVSCTQLTSPSFGIRYHLKAILDHFFQYWNTDRSVLKRIGRPPQELMSQFLKPGLFQE